MELTKQRVGGLAPSVVDFELAPELEAHDPPEARGLLRDEVRLLVSSRTDPALHHAQFTDLPSFLRPGDLLVANDSATLPAELTATDDAGTEVILHLSTQLEGNLWAVEPRQTEVTAGQALSLPGGGLAILLSSFAGSRRLWVARLFLPAPVEDYLWTWGRPITYAHIHGEWPLDMYQTVYAEEAGSAEMPSAGRAFSTRVLDELSDRGIGFVTLTLHTGVSSLEDHEPPYDERFSVPAATASAINGARRRGGRIIAVGTTVVRALETVADRYGRAGSGAGWTDLMITPERGVKVVDGLLTGFHEPKSTHLLMLQAIAGQEQIDRAYRAAIEGQYLWHEFGDLHLILP